MNHETVAKLHAAIDNQVDYLERQLNESAGSEHPLAIRFRAEWSQELDEVLEDKADFLEMAGTDTISAVEKYLDYLLPFQLGIKREIERIKNEA